MSCAVESPRTPAIATKKTTKLRASCNACNESKVRCSQTKPTCMRCEKQSIQCIYGLSRRTHKDAPRVGAPVSSRRNSLSPGLVQEEGTQANTAQPSQLNDDATNPSEESIFTSLDFANQRTNCFDISSILDLPPYQTDTSMTAPPESGLFLDMTSSSDTQVNQDMDCFNLPPMLQVSPFHMDTMMTPQSGDISSLFNSSPDGSSKHIHSTPPSTESDFRIDDDSSKTSVVELLLSRTLQLNENAAVSFDVHLSELKHAIKICDVSIKSKHALRDEITILTVGILVYQIIRGFEATLPTGGSEPRAMAAGRQHSKSSPPRLSWGVLQIEDEDENHLKQHLWLLHFRKLEGLIKQLGTLHREMKTNQGGASSMHVMACEFIIMWLEQKTQAVGKKFPHETK